MLSTVAGAVIQWMAVGLTQGEGERVKSYHSNVQVPS